MRDLQRGVMGAVGLWCVACGGPGAQPTKPVGGPAPALCVDLATATGESLSPNQEADANLVLPDDAADVGAQAGPGWLALASADGSGTGPTVTYVVAVTEACTMGGSGECEAKAVRLEGGKVTAEAVVAVSDNHPGLADGPVSVDWLAVQDGDHDGAPELWLAYQVAGVPEPAVGSTSVAHFAAFDPATLAPRLDLEVGAYPEADSLDMCESELTLVDADCDGDTDVVQAQTCRPALCTDDPAGDPACATPTVTPSLYLRGPQGAFAADVR